MYALYRIQFQCRLIHKMSFINVDLNSFVIMFDTFGYAFW